MATGHDEMKNLLKLTDCSHFARGYCMFNQDTCRFRHCQAAIKQLEKCSHWPDLCRNNACPFRHIGLSSKIPKYLSQEKGFISFFWDIENVPIPKRQNPFDIVQRIRQKLVIESGLQETDFSCYCDSNKISQENQISLHHANVRIVHVPDRKSNAVDRQIMLDLDRFERLHHPPATIVLISGDIDFVSKLSDLRHHAGFHVIVIHNRPAKEELKATANEHYSWELFTESPQQQQLVQPTRRDKLERLTNLSANFRRVSNHRRNNDCNVNPIPSSNLKAPYVPSKVDLRRENNRVQNNYWQTNDWQTNGWQANDWQTYGWQTNDWQTNDWQTNYSVQNRRSRSMNRNHRSRSGTPRSKPPMTQLVNQSPVSNVGNNIYPSAPTPIVVPPARGRQTVSTDRQNISIPGPCKQIPALNNDDTAKIQRYSHSCPHCTKAFSTIKELRQHQNDKKHLFDCPRCTVRCSTLAGLEQHQITKGHNVSTNKDDQCNVQLDTTDNLNRDQSATPCEHNFNTSNNNKRLPMYHSQRGISETLSTSKKC